MTRARILLFSDWFFPGFKGGGSQIAVTNLVEALREEFDFWVVTRNHDLGEARPYTEAANGRGWSRQNGINICYLDPGEERYNVIAEIVRSTPHELLHLNSVISRLFSATPAAARLFLKSQSSLLVSPHGEMSHSALEKKALRKILFLSAMKIVNIFRHATWHASSFSEEQDIKRIWGHKASVSVVPLVVPERIFAANSLFRAPKKAGTLRTIFFSRIDSMKNLDLAIDFISNTPQSTLDIYGPISQPDYWALCEERIKASNRSYAFRYLGSLKPERVVSTLSQYDVLLQPSQSENFGYTILEALTAGCPVLISDKTPWRGLEAAGLGADIPLSSREKFIASLERLRDLDETQHAIMRDNARRYAENHIRKSSARSAMTALYVSAIERI